MELLLLTTLCILSLLLTSSCAYSHQTDRQLLSSLQQVHDQGISLTKLPRKLGPVEEPSILKRCKTEDSKPEVIKKEDLSGKMINSHVMVNGREGTRQRWIERKDMWQFFTMDYNHIRRRRPIHNKKVMPTRQP